MATPQKWQQQTLAPGFWVAITLKPDAAPLRVYVGQIQAVDTHGVRLTLVDWLVGNASSWDFYAPWETITCALLATPDHDLGQFGERAADWQQRMEEPAGQATAGASETEAA
jgi:hypothetical protein